MQADKKAEKDFDFIWLYIIFISFISYIYDFNTYLINAKYKDWYWSHSGK